jgi:hypothetical protein
VFAVGGSQSGRQVLVGSDKSHNLWINWSAAIDNQQFVAPAPLCISSIIQRQGLAANIASIFAATVFQLGLAPRAMACTEHRWLRRSEWHRGLDALCRSAATEEPDSGHPRGHEQRYAVQQLEKCRLGVPDATAAVIAALGART